MKTTFAAFASGDEIPVFEHLKDRKLAKYFSRESAAAVVCLGRLLREAAVEPATPVYYATGITEHEDYGLPGIVRNSVDETGAFSSRLFIQKGFADVPPITQFKLLANMPLCFLSLNYGFNGDNAVVYSSAAALLRQALFAPVDEDIVIGAGKVYPDGGVSAGFALVSKEELGSSPFLTSSAEAVEMFRLWAGEVGG